MTKPLAWLSVAVTRAGDASGTGGGHAVASATVDDATSPGPTIAGGAPSPIARVEDAVGRWSGTNRPLDCPAGCRAPK